MFDFKGRIYPTQYPSGRWGFVGSVPVSLSYRMKDGSEVAPELARDVARFGRGLFGHLIDAVTFDSKADAVAAAVALGFIDNPESERIGMSREG